MRFVISAILLTCSTLIGAPPEVPTEPIVGESKETLFFDIKGDASKVAFAPGFDPIKCKVVRLHSDDPKIISYMAFPKADGEYYVTFWTEGEKKYNQVILRSGKWDKKAEPKPEPEPEPKPKPDPTPVKYDKIWIVVVEDVNAVRTIETAKMLNDKFWVDIAPKAEFRHYLNKSETAKEYGYVAEAEKAGVGYPAVILIDDATKKVIKSFRATGINIIANEVGKVVK